MSNQDDYQRGYDDGVASKRQSAAEIYGRGVAWAKVDQAKVEAERDRYKKALEDIAFIPGNRTRDGLIRDANLLNECGKIAEQALKEEDE